MRYRLITFGLLCLLCAWYPKPIQAQLSDMQLELYHQDTARRDRYNTQYIDDNDVTWVAYTSYRGVPENIYLRRHNPTGISQEWQIGDGAARDIEPVIVGDADGVWVFWAAKSMDNWDIFARRVQDGKLSPTMRLTMHEATDWMPEAVVDSAGRIWLFWVSFRNGSYDIYCKRWTDGNWSEPESVDGHPRFDYRPSAAADGNGNVWVCWDTDRSGFYDLYMRRHNGQYWSALERVTDHPALDTDASLSVDSQGVLWLAWQTNRTERESTGNRTPLATGRPRVWTAVKSGGRWKYPPPVEAKGQPGTVSPVERPDGNNPQIVLDQKGAPWVLWFAGEGPGFLRNLRLRARPWTGTGWGEMHTLMDGFSDIFAYNHYAGFTSDGRLHASWYIRAGDKPGRPNAWGYQVFDGQTVHQSGVPTVNAIPNRNIEMGTIIQPAMQAVLPAEKLARTTVVIDGREKQLYFGDNHSHNMFCDGRYRPDHLLAYAKYITQIDFAAVTSHSQSFIWADWEMMKTLSRDYSRDGEFLVLPGYEWTNGDSNGGHQVVIFPSYEAPMYSTKDPFTERLEQFQGLLGRTSGLTSTHHIGTIYRDWDVWNSKIEPYLEITSKSRVFENVSALETPNFRIGGRKLNDQTIQNIMARGYWLGFIGNSDTHTGRQGAEAGVTGVYMDELTIPAMFRAFKDRLVFAAEGNIALQVQVNDRFMGDELLLDALPAMREIRVTYQGTQPVERVDIVRNNVDIYSFQGDGSGGEFTFVDREPLPESAWFPVPGDEKRGTVYYYVRLTQNARSRAWSTPVWLRIKKH
jgi:hypothetical protein